MNTGEGKQTLKCVEARQEGSGTEMRTVTSTTPFLLGDGGFASPGRPGFAFSVTSYFLGMAS